MNINDIIYNQRHSKYMEQLTTQITIRVSEADVELLRAQATEQRRSLAWVARENMRKGLATAN